MEEEFNVLKRKFLSYSLKSESEAEVLNKAWEFAQKAHSGQKRLSGEPYVSHPLNTASILVDWKLDLATVAAGFLHDTIEDAGVKKEELEVIFGSEITNLVEGVTKVSKVKLRGSHEDQFVENLRRMFLAMAYDLRVVFIKLADRLHNMKTLWALPEEKRKRIAQETLEIYAPLAERLGMGEIHGALEDLAFCYLYPTDYERLVKLSRSFYKTAEETIKIVKRNYSAF